jgi:hypothetical protein
LAQVLIRVIAIRWLVAQMLFWSRVFWVKL